MKIESVETKLRDIVITLSAEEACRLKFALFNLDNGSWPEWGTDNRRIVFPNKDKSHQLVVELGIMLEKEGIYF